MGGEISIAAIYGKILRGWGKKLQMHNFRGRTTFVKWKASYRNCWHQFPHECVSNWGLFRSCLPQGSAQSHGKSPCWHQCYIPGERLWLTHMVSTSLPTLPPPHTRQRMLEEKASIGSGFLNKLCSCVFNIKGNLPDEPSPPRRENLLIKIQQQGPYTRAQNPDGTVLNCPAPSPHISTVLGQEAAQSTSATD